MITQIPDLTWEEAYKGFFLHKKAVRSPRTALWYRAYVGALVEWAASQDIELSAFTKRHLDAYLSHRQDTGRKPVTLHHDALTACVFFEWCKKNDILTRDPLADYQVRNAPTPPK